MSATVKLMCKWEKKHFKHPDMHMHIAIVDLIFVVSEFFFGDGVFFDIGGVWGFLELFGGSSTLRPAHTQGDTPHTPHTPKIV